MGTYPLRAKISWRGCWRSILQRESPGKNFSSEILANGKIVASEKSEVRFKVNNQIINILAIQTIRIEWILKIHKFEKVTLQFLKKLISVRNNAEFISLISVYKEKFEAIAQMGKARKCKLLPHLRCWFTRIFRCDRSV